MSVQSRLLFASAGLIALILVPLAAGWLLSPQLPGARGAALAVPEANLALLRDLPVAQIPAGGVTEFPLALSERVEHHHCLTRREWILAMHSRQPVSISEECRLITGRWTGLVTGRTTDTPATMTIMPAIPLELAFESGLKDNPRHMQRWTAPTQAEAWLWLPVRKSAARRRGGRSIEDWQPGRPELRCSYARRWMAAKVIFNLAASLQEKEAIEEILAECGKAERRVLSLVQPIDRLPELSSLDESEMRHSAG